jgi:hypothetical protein
MTDKSILFFDDDPNNSNPSIDKNLGIVFVNIQGEKGMTTQKIKSYITRIKGLKKVRAAYFDWDLTLSRQNSISYDDYKKATIKNNLEFYFGSDKRQKALKELFKAIKSKGGKLYILTRNGTAIYKHERTFFKEMMNKLQGNKDFNLKQLHYCPPSISKSAYIKKVN